MKLFYSYCILVFFVLLPGKSPGQVEEVKFSLFSGTSGVTLGKINGMTRDKYGYLWFSDQSNRCIIRFDGSHMTRYENDPQNPNSLGGYYPECLFSDSSGNIWIGFYGMGVDKFDPVANKFTHYRHNDKDGGSLGNDFVSSVLVDHLGNVWVGDYGGVDLLNEKTGKFKHYRNNPSDPTSLSCDSVRAIYEDRAGELWVGTGFAFEPTSDNGGLNRFNRRTGTFTRYMHDPENPHSLISNKVRAIFEDSYGNFWIGTNGDGLHTMDRKTGLFERHTYDPKHPDKLGRPALGDAYDHITFITEDAARKIWIGTLENGIARYDPGTKKITHYGDYNGGTGLTKDNSSWWANATPDGLIWLSTQKANVFKIDIYHTIISEFGDQSSSFDNHAVLAFAEESASVMWYATPGGLVRKDRVKGTTRKFINEPGNENSLDDTAISSLLKDKQGGLWIGTAKGLNRFDFKTEKFTRYHLDSTNKTSLHVVKICQDRNSNIWLATFGNGVYRLDRESGKFTHYRNNPADTSTISNDFVSAIVEDNSGDLWIGSALNSGINKLNTQTGKLTRYLPGLSIGCICQDDDNVVWIGTESGLFRYDKKSNSCKSVGGAEIGANIVQIDAITKDKENNLWIAAETGIYMLNSRRDQVIRIGKEHGIPEANNFFQYGSSFTRQDGELNFGNSTGYVSFYPERLKISDTTTKLYFTGLALDNKEIVPDKNGPLSESLYDAKLIRLRHDQNVFSLRATSIDFRNVGKPILCYLENYDQGWRTVQPEEKIQYFKVPPGKYVFRIKTANSTTGEWTEKSINIIILPPWWTTWWAYCIYGIIFCALVVLVHRYQKNRIIRAEREHSRAKELAQAKEIEKAYYNLGETHEALKATQSQLIQQEKMASLGELTAGIAHEIQNPLNFVNNFSEVNKELIIEMNNEIDSGNLNEARTIAKSIEDNEEKIIFHGRRADAIVKNMLQHSRSSSNKKEPTDINALVDEYLRLSYHGLRAKDKTFNAVFRTELDNSIGKIDLVPQDFGRVLLNLYNNAFYTVSEKKNLLGGQYEPAVSVSTKKLDGKVQVTIRDNGNGIPRSVIDKIFQPFFTTKPTGLGTGLGLSLSYDIIKAHGGELKVETKEGEGSEFIIQLPV